MLAHASRQLQPVADLLLVRRLRISFVRTALLLFFISTLTVGADPAASDMDKRAQTFATETIPLLELKDASFEDALAAVRHAWEQHLRSPVGTFTTSSEGGWTTTIQH